MILLSNATMIRFLLLCAIKDAISFENLCHINRVVLLTFQAACLTQSLLEDDNEWRQCLWKAANMTSSHQLHNLFVTILYDCSLSDPLALWLEFWENICDDIHYIFHFQDIVNNPTQDQGFILSIRFFVLERRLCKTSQSCLFLRWIGI